jgi:predicted DNA binding CopG/RHH family protein
MARKLKSKSRVEKDMLQIEKDAELWENGQLGASVEHAVRVPEAEAKIIDAMIDDAFDLRSVTIRLQKGLVREFEQFAKQDGIGYQPLMRMILTKYATERKAKS